MDIMELVAKGVTTPMIAKTLGISESTVKNHVTAIFDRLKVTSRAEAVATLVKRGWRP